MKCTRCKEKLKEGENIYHNWHIPICTKCRNIIIDSGSVELSHKERSIMVDRFKKDKSEDMRSLNINKANEVGE